jgi:dsDNA-specific endonuclease/ATPase MutS2
MHEFWIGDWVRNKTTGETGTYEGTSRSLADKVKVKIHGQVQLMDPGQLEMLTEKEVEAIRYNERTKKERIPDPPGAPKPQPFDDILDLHIEKLAPHLKGKQVELILNKQLDAARSHLEEAIKRRQLKATIIHGKGSGALKMEIEHLLEEYIEVFFTRPVHNGGGVEVIFRYF